MTDVAEMKQQARATWAAGDFDAVVPFIWEAGTAAAKASQCGPGDRVLDIAAGSGNAAIQAALRGADVVAPDLTPELFEPGRRRAAEHGVELEWVEADAEQLPFEAASFDAAISTFGIMFAPPPVGRGSRAGARRPAGFIGEMFKTIASFLNPPPPPEGPADDGTSNASRRRRGRDRSPRLGLRRSSGRQVPFVEEPAGRKRRSGQRRPHELESVKRRTPCVAFFRP